MKLVNVSELAHDKATIHTQDCLPLQGKHALHLALLSVDLEGPPALTVAGLGLLALSPALHPSSSLLCSTVGLTTDYI